MGDYRFLKLYRTILILALVILIGYTLFTACVQYDILRQNFFSGIVSQFLLPGLSAFGILATIQIITAVIENDEQQQLAYHDLINRTKAVIERVDRLEKANAELVSKLRSLSDQQTKGS